MKRITRSLLVLFACAVAAVLPLAAEESRTLKGTFVWSGRDATGDLEAVFTPKGENLWDVAFHFEFRGEPHTYSGTAEGSLTDGALKGRVLNENQKRTFTFEGAFREGKFSGTHAEVEDGAAEPTGSLTLGG